MTKIKLYYAATFLSGLLLGWLAIGWWLWPVAYVGEAYTYELNQADRLRYASAVVDSYAATGLSDPAWFSGWYADEIQQALEQVAQKQPARANQARALEGLALQQVGNTYIMSPSGHVLQVKTHNQASEINLDNLAIIGIIALALVVAGVGFWLLWRNRAVNPEPVRGFETAFVGRDEPNLECVTNPHILPTVPGEFQGLRGAVTTARTLAQAQLTFGPDQSTDQHLPIEQDGTHLGEFGVSQVEGMQAWDVWLFDQKALVTVTKVLANQASEELAGRGEVLNWREPFNLETPNLKMAGLAVKQLEDGMKVELSVEGKDETV